MKNTKSTGVSGKTKPGGDASAKPSPKKALASVRTHKWVGQQQGGSPAEAGSYEWVRYCSVCGMEDTCEDPLPPCPGEKNSPSDTPAFPPPNTEEPQL